MNGNYFLDTNVLVYSFDEVHKSKRQKANALIQDALRTQKGMISYQIIQEFLSTTTKKFSVHFKQEDLKDYVQAVLWPLCAVYPSQELFQSALSCHYQHRISFYDALVVSAAFAGGCKILYSEDLQHGQVISGVKIQNPFL